MMELTRQKLPVLDRTPLGNATGTLRGAYVLSRESGTTADLILIATGSEVPLALEAQGLLGAAGINTRVVSMPSWELFRNQDQEYRDHVLPPAVGARLAVEAGATQGWLEWVGPRGDVIGLDRFGASAPAAENFSHFGFTAANVVERARALVQAG
jgi:transketolase